MNNDAAVLLPNGEKLKPLLKRSVISESDMQNLLKNRGVFILNKDRKSIVQFLTTTLISPKEFEALQEIQKIKEDNIKVRNTKLKSQTSNALLEVMDLDIIDSEEIENNIDCCTFQTDTSLNIENENHMYVEYEVLSEDITLEWSRIERKFQGRVDVIKDPELGSIKFSSEYTSGETEEINSEIIKKISKFLKEQNEVSSKEILDLYNASRLNNKNRMKFLLGLANNIAGGNLQFSSVRNIEIGKDKTKNAAMQEKGILFEEGVKNLIINSEKGESLNNIAFIANEDHYDFLILRALQVEYRFEYLNAKGSCVLEFGFPHFFRKSNRTEEFEVIVNKVFLDKNKKGESIKRVSRKILADFNHFYQKEFNKMIELQKRQGVKEKQEVEDEQIEREE